MVGYLSDGKKKIITLNIFLKLYSVNYLVGRFRNSFKLKSPI